MLQRLKSGKTKEMLWMLVIDVVVFVFLAVFPAMANDFRLNIMSKCMCYIVFAYSIDLLWGYIGLMSMGHAVFFGIGAYILAIGYAMHDGVPSFMRAIGVTKAPAFYYFLANKPVAFFAALILSGVVAGILGAFLFSKKVNSVFFSLITFALARVFSLFITDMQAYTGGQNGITKIPTRLFAEVDIPKRTYYYILLGIVILVYLFCRFLTGSRYGLILEAIRENEGRTMFFGYNPMTFKIQIFVVSAVIAALAGVMFTTSQNFIGPTNVGIAASTAVLVWLALGGRGNITGATVGTLLVCWCESLFSEKLGDYWVIIYGVMILLIVYLMPKGIIGQIKETIYNNKAAKAKSTGAGKTTFKVLKKAG